MLLLPFTLLLPLIPTVCPEYFANGTVLNAACSIQVWMEPCECLEDNIGYCLRINKEFHAASIACAASSCPRIDSWRTLNATSVSPLLSATQSGSNAGLYLQAQRQTTVHPYALHPELCPCELFTRESFDINYSHPATAVWIDPGVQPYTIIRPPCYADITHIADAANFHALRIGALNAAEARVGATDCIHGTYPEPEDLVAVLASVSSQ